MAGVSAGTTKLLAALANRARTEINAPRSDSVSMKPGDEIKPPEDAPLPVEHQLHLAAGLLRDPVAATELAEDNAFGAMREVALLAAHERAVQRMSMSRMRLMGLYRNRLRGRIGLLEYGIPEGLVTT